MMISMVCFGREGDAIIMRASDVDIDVSFRGRVPCKEER
jgi:hypothetical protein